MCSPCLQGFQRLMDSVDLVKGDIRIRSQQIVENPETDPHVPGH